MILEWIAYGLPSIICCVREAVAAEDVATIGHVEGVQVCGYVVVQLRLLGASVAVKPFHGGNGGEAHDDKVVNTDWPLHWRFPEFQRTKTRKAGGIIQTAASSRIWINEKLSYLGSSTVSRQKFTSAGLSNHRNSLIFIGFSLFVPAPKNSYCYCWYLQVSSVTKFIPTNH